MCAPQFVEGLQLPQGCRASALDQILQGVSVAHPPRKLIPLFYLVTKRKIRQQIGNLSNI